MNMRGLAVSALLLGAASNSACRGATERPSCAADRDCGPGDAERDGGDGDGARFDVRGGDMAVHDGGRGSSCTADRDCADANPCSVDRCVSRSCQHSAVSGTHLACRSGQCRAVANTTSSCSDQGGCSTAGATCSSATGSCPRSKCPFDAQERYLDGIYPSFGLPYNDKWKYLSGGKIINPDHPKYTARSCRDDKRGGAIRGSTHIRALHSKAIDVALTGMTSAQQKLVKATLTDSRGWQRTGVRFSFSTRVTTATDIHMKYCSSCSVSVSGARGHVNDKCGGKDITHRDSDYNLIQFSSGSCLKALSGCSRWVINHEVGHALGLADRENPATKGKSIMNHTHYYRVIWPSKQQIDMVVALEKCAAKTCMGL